MRSNASHIQADDGTDDGIITKFGDQLINAIAPEIHTSEHRDYGVFFFSVLFIFLQFT